MFGENWRPALRLCLTLPGSTSQATLPTYLSKEMKTRKFEGSWKLPNNPSESPPPPAQQFQLCHYRLFLWHINLTFGTSKLKYFLTKNVFVYQHFFSFLWRSRWKNIIDTESFKDHQFHRHTERDLPAVLEKSFPLYPSWAPRPGHEICHSVI